MNIAQSVGAKPYTNQAVSPARVAGGACADNIHKKVV